MNDKEVNALMESVQPQIDAAEEQFNQCMASIQQVVKQYGFSGFLISVGFEPTAKDGTPLYLALAAHRDTPGPQHLTALMQSSVEKANDSLEGFLDAPAPEQIASKPRRGYA